VFYLPLFLVQHKKALLFVPFICWLIIVTIPVSGLTEHAHAQTEPLKEYYVKAGFLVNFARLVEWPEAGKTQNIVIGILDNAPFGDSLNIIRKKEIHGRKIIIKVCDTATDYTGVHLLFLNSEDREFRKAILKKIGTIPVLTIGETPGFASREGIINFFKYQNKLRFEINQTKAEKVGLKVSSRLLKFGKIVQ